MKQEDSEPHLNEGVTAALIVLAAVVNPDVLRNKTSAHLVTTEDMGDGLSQL